MDRMEVKEQELLAEGYNERGIKWYRQLERAWREAQGEGEIVKIDKRKL